MALVINTNISSLTAQRALAESNTELQTAMERLSTGSKINSAADDAAGLAMVQRMTAQVRGLAMAVKNANDGQALTQSVEGALGEVSDMLQRMRELALQAANGTNSSADRSFLQSEVNLLIQEISRVAANTRYNGELILDGTFLNKSLQVGIEEGENIIFSVESVAAEMIGAHTLVGNGQSAAAADQAPPSNDTTTNDDIEIFGFLGTVTTAASPGDSAKETAVKVNNLTGQTGVKAYAKTYASLYSATTTQKTYSIKINGYETGNFVIAEGDVESAVDAINQISGSTGVTASSSDNKILLFDADGDDITIENSQTLAGHNDLRVQKIGEDGVITNTVGSAVSLAVSGANDATRVSGTLKLVSPNAFSIDQKAVNQVETVTVGTLSDYDDNGGATTVGDGTTTVSLDYSGGAPADIDTLLANIQADSNYGDLLFTVSKASNNTDLEFTWKAAGVPSGTATYVSAGAGDEGIATGTTGVASKGYYTENAAAASLKNLTQIQVSTMVAAGDSISIIDAALDKVAQMRSDLGAIENRLGYTISNLMNIAEKTADARSRLDDADFALESARLAKAQVIQQAGTSMLSQANQLTQLVLDLLR
jgi:flagellin